MKEQIKQLFDEYEVNDMTFFELEKQVLGLFSVSGCCLEPCALGDEGHCSRTEKEYLHHCEKLNNSREPQRATIKLKISESNNR